MRIRIGPDGVGALAGILFAGLSACSAQPDRSADAVTAVPTSAAPASTSGNATAKATEPKPAADKVPAGYRRVTRGGKEYFCRSETIVGTKLPETFCFTREQIREIEERADSVMDSVGHGCAGSSCGGGEGG